MIFGIVLVVLIALLAVAVLVAVVGYVYQTLKRGKKTSQAAEAQKEHPGIASSAIDKEAAPPPDPSRAPPASRRA